MRFIHAADIHLDSPLRGLERYEGAPVEELRGATRKAFTKLIALCQEEAVDFLLIAGDVYDGDWQDYNTGLFFTKQMARLRDAGIPVFLIRGNHDAESKITRQLRLPDNVYCFDSRHAQSKPLDDLGVVVHGRSFATQAVTENLSTSYPAPIRGLFNIGLLHTSADGRPGHESYAPCSRENLLAKGYHYWALGHVHEREVIGEEEPWIVFPGNLQGRHVRETGGKGCSIVTVESGGGVQVEHRNLDVVRWCRRSVDASGAKSIDELLSRTQSAFEQELRSAGECLVAARLTFTGACAVHRSLVTKPDAFIAEVRSMAGSLGNVWVEKIALDTRSQIDLDLIAQQNDPLGQLIQYTRQLKDDDAALQELLSEFSELKRKLPAELIERILPDESTLIRGLLDEVEQLLVPRLLEEKELA
ncbi:MAG: repair exonuclease [Chthoniobacteraceae bacterium]|nr:repair exonuclease [Chthoniobacteraceae bacterium]